MSKIIKVTVNYGNFYFSNRNRDVDLEKNKARLLRESIKEYGWIDSFPMTCYRNGQDGLEILDGQHRFSIARELGVPVKYVVIDENIEISRINNTQDTWSNRYYMKRWQKEGLEPYFEVQDFMNTHDNVPLGMAIALLNGGNSFTSALKKRFENGQFKCKGKGLAYRVANLYEKIIQHASNAKNANFLKALFACYHVEDFDPQRLLDSCQKRPHMIQSYSKIEDFLEMIEEIYNYGKKSGRIPLKFQAQEANRDRSPIG